MFYKISKAEALPHYMLSIDFENGVTKYYDIKPLFKKWDGFKIFLSDTALFQNVKVDTGGYGISWNDDLDLSCNELYHNGKE